jgi:hypothetical protein
MSVIFNADAKTSPPKIASLHAQTLQHMRYYIKTQHGCLNKYNGHMIPDPFLGSGQGAGDSMTRWGFLSDAIICAYNKVAISAPVQAPISTIIIQDKNQAFVDDSHGIIIHNESSPLSLHNTIQHNIQAWEKLLHNVGGELEIMNVASFALDTATMPNQTLPPHLTTPKILQSPTMKPAQRWRFWSHVFMLHSSS